jgi:hypothetical protein
MQGRILKPAHLAAPQADVGAQYLRPGRGPERHRLRRDRLRPQRRRDGFETNVLVSADGRRVAVLLLNGRTADNRGDSIAVAASQRLYCAG